ncbi:MAG TPA: tRNA (adenosine(37)-N6)-dimethylallyltransferase MiaA [Candidatus Binataceae bacterium]|nr:tRNA (adenosine(37)-N6)-dimethylallyltransferase MiaA [Candidatus Binataceae bacterium]
MRGELAARNLHGRESSALSKTRVGFIVGPTGVGKTAVAIAIAERLGAEIVNADSRQVYRGMDLGTAKPSIEERQRVPHHLIDIRTPDRPLDVAEFARLAREQIDEIAARNHAVLVVGGSGLYLRALRDGIFAGPPASLAVRAKLMEFAAQHGTSALHRRLVGIDELAAATISPNDLKRSVRALEVFELTGTPLSAHHARHRFTDRPYVTLTVGLTLPRDQLYALIDQRFDRMIEAGFVDEVRALLDRESGALALADTIGYREIAEFIAGGIDLASAIVRAKRESRRLAKRQLTWFRADAEVRWLDARAALPVALELFTDFFQAGRMKTEA